MWGRRSAAHVPHGELFPIPISKCAGSSDESLLSRRPQDSYSMAPSFICWAVFRIAAFPRVSPSLDAKDQYSFHEVDVHDRESACKGVWHMLDFAKAKRACLAALGRPALRT